MHQEEGQAEAAQALHEPTIKRKGYCERMGKGKVNVRGKVVMSGCGEVAGIVERRWGGGEDRRTGVGVEVQRRSCARQRGRVRARPVRLPA